ncbi:MAG: 4-hydroxy-tetrahydrodipicolinate synthase [Elusimicrobiaceae bacterium]|nr:4-hydroxy-tetrahydrodipicolinate synthase [Elusimicrobiaceae bacterium]
MFQGIFVALITPFNAGKVDYEALSALIEKQIAAGVSGFCLLGTTAEPPALTDKEKEEILSFCTKQIKGRAKIIVGVGSNSTEHTLSNVTLAKQFNPDAYLVVTPYYNKPNLSGMIAHFTAVAKEAKKPLVLYHIPSRTGQRLSVDFLGKLLKSVPQIKAIKEADYDIARVVKASTLYGKDVAFLGGNDDLWQVLMGLNFPGLISAAGNVLTPAFIKMQKAFSEGNYKESKEIFDKVFPLIEALYFEVNPTCVKYALSCLGLCKEDVRLPLGKIQEETKQKIKQILAATPKEFII